MNAPACRHRRTRPWASTCPPTSSTRSPQDLRAKGVTFEDYDVPEIGLKTVNGIAEFEGTKAAWFKDSEDNIINIVST